MRPIRPDAPAMAIFSGCAIRTKPCCDRKDNQTALLRLWAVISLDDDQIDKGRPFAGCNGFGIFGGMITGHSLFIAWKFNHDITTFGTAFGDFVGYGVPASCWEGIMDWGGTYVSPYHVWL